MSQIELKSAHLSAKIHGQGAELNSLQTPQGLELIWQAETSIWARHAPILFPIVGRLANDRLTHEGKHYPLSQHGFARDMAFDCITQQPDYCLMRLSHNDTTLGHYPFEFQLDVSYQLLGAALIVTYALSNPSNNALYASIGAHPAFNWPLTSNGSKADHWLEFSQIESAPIRRLHEGLLTRERITSPVRGKQLALHDDLFQQDALIFDQLSSRQITYSAPNAMRVRLNFEDFPHLGLWSKPGAGFICIEPWQGHASPVDFDGEFKEKPGVISLPGNSQRQWQYTISVDI